MVFWRILPGILRGDRLLFRAVHLLRTDLAGAVRLSFIIATVVHFYDRFRDRISLRLEVSAVTALTAIFVVFVCVEIAMGVNFFSLDKQSADYVIVLAHRCGERP